MSKLYRARSLLYRRQILQVNIRWKALDEIYKIYMLLHRSDLNISENFRQNFSHIFVNSKAHGCQGSGSTLGLSRKQLAHELREGSGALRDETHPADSNFLQTETRGRQMSIDVHPSLRRCLEKKSNSQDHRNEKTRSRRYEKL